MRRPSPLAAVAIVLVLVLVLAGGLALARFLGTEGVERGLLLDRVRTAEGGRDITVLRIDSATAYALGRERGPTRIAYRVAGDSKVRCADVERRGSVLSGRRIILHRLSAPVGLQAGC